MSMNIVESLVRVIPWASRSDTLLGTRPSRGKVTRGKETLLRHRVCSTDGESEEFTDHLCHEAEDMALREDTVLLATGREETLSGEHPRGLGAPAA